MFSLIKIRKNRKGFTLIELLVVIAIIAVLSVVVILTLNPAELLKQARDSNRISDLATMKSAVSLYLADVTSPNIGTSTVADFSTAGTSTAITATSSWGMGTAVIASALATTTRNVNGTGWLPVNFSLISSGAPIGSLPVDPSNNSSTVVTNNDGGISTGTFYGYIPSGTTFKLVAHMESKKYTSTGTGDVESTDGGVSTGTYEQGTNLAL